MNIEKFIDSEIEYFEEMDMKKFTKDDWSYTEMRDYDSGRLSAFLDLSDLVKYRSKDIFELYNYIQSNIIREEE